MKFQKSLSKEGITPLSALMDVIVASYNYGDKVIVTVSYPTSFVISTEALVMLTSLINLIYFLNLIYYLNSKNSLRRRGKEAFL